MGPFVVNDIFLFVTHAFHERRSGTFLHGQNLYSETLLFFCSVQVETLGYNGKSYYCVKKWCNVPCVWFIIFITGK